MGQGEQRVATSGVAADRGVLRVVVVVCCAWARREREGEGRRRSEKEKAKKGGKREGKGEKGEKRGASTGFAATVAHSGFRSVRQRTCGTRKRKEDGTAIDFGVGTTKFAGKDLSSTMERF